jgi:hypothetical protein
MDPRGFPTTLPEFQRVFPDDAACAAYLESVRWPEGFVCRVSGRATPTPSEPDIRRPALQRLQEEHFAHRAAMVRPERDTIGSKHPVEIDECLIGGET